MLVLEDVHWADEATLDVLRMLTRKIETAPALVVVSYRDDEIHRAHPLRIVLGELANRSGIDRLERKPAVAERRRRPRRAATVGPGCALRSLQRATPSTSREVLAAGGNGIPSTVRDAVLARAARLNS